MVHHLPHRIELPCTTAFLPNIFTYKHNHGGTTILGIVHCISYNFLRWSLVSVRLFLISLHSTDKLTTTTPTRALINVSRTHCSPSGGHLIQHIPGVILRHVRRGRGTQTEVQKLHQGRTNVGEEWKDGRRND